MEYIINNIKRRSQKSYLPKERSFVTSKRSYAFQKQRQEDRKFEARLSYIVSSRPVWAAQETPVSKIPK